MRLRRDTACRRLPVAASVGNADEASALVSAAHKAFGRLDVLVNNAGITHDGLMVRMKEEDFDSVINVNLKGTFLCCKAAGQIMMKQRYGRIINMSSISGIGGNAGQVNYAALEGRRHRADEDHRARAGGARRHGERRGPRVHCHGHDRRAVRKAARGHWRADPAQALRAGGRCGAPGAFLGKRRGRLHHRPGHLR